MKYVVRRKTDHALLALPETIGASVRWVTWESGVLPWTFETRGGADKARDMHIGKKHASVEPVRSITLAAAA